MTETLLDRIKKIQLTDDKVKVDITPLRVIINKMSDYMLGRIKTEHSRGTSYINHFTFVPSDWSGDQSIVEQIAGYFVMEGFKVQYEHHNSGVKYLHLWW